MRPYFPKGFAVSEKDQKPSPSERSSQLSASGLPSSDRSLELVLSAINNTIRSFESVIKMLHDEVTIVTKAIHSEVTSQGQLNMARHELAVRLLGKIRVELATLTDQLRDLLTSNKIQLGATVEAKDALERTREKLEGAAKEMTGQHALLQAEDEEGKAPLVIRRMAVKLTNFVWPVAVRSGKDALRWGFKLATGSVTIGALGKIIHMLLTGHFQ
jgi:hypothetical protein